jgi:serine/threonine-protein kinase
MHKHLKQPLVPADHVNTNLSAGIGEIIDVAMAKDREERYNSTEDMLEDLEAVRRGEPPLHARRDIKLDELAKVEESAKTIDILPGQQAAPVIWSSPIVMLLLIAVGISVLANVIMLVALATRH